MRPLRVSAISYLNTAPLMWDFEHGARKAELRKRFQIEYTIPSRCAEKLATAQAEIGIIPVAAYPTIPDLRILSDVAIATKNAVRSILLVSKLPLERIRTVALDNSSQTSAVLVQLLFAAHWRRDVTFVTAEPRLETMLAVHDAALLIGDPALQVDRSLYLTWDLAEEWRNFSGLPFVFAFWAIRAGSVSDEELTRTAETFALSRDEGLRHIPEISSAWSPILSLSERTIREYLTDNIHYYLDAANLEGMKLFFDLSASHGLLPVAPELRFARDFEVRNSASSNRI